MVVPHEWAFMDVVLIDVPLDAGDQLTHALERSATNCLLVDQTEPAPDLIEPTRVCRRDQYFGPAR